MTQRVGKLPGQPVPRSPTHRKLHGVELRIACARNLGDAREIGELREDGPGGLQTGIGCRARSRLIDVLRDNQFPALASDVTGLNYDLRRKLMLNVQAEVLHVGGPKILIDSVHSERRLRRDAAKDRLLIDHSKRTAIVLNTKDRFRATGISRGTPSSGLCAVVNA